VARELGVFAVLAELFGREVRHVAEEAPASRLEYINLWMEQLDRS